MLKKLFYILILLIPFLPLVYYALQLIDKETFQMHYMGLLYLFVISLAAMIFYVYSVIANRSLKQHQKVNWVVALVVLSTPAMIAYWFKHLRTVVGSES